MNTKYEITDIVHEKYPCLHRVRALRDIGSEVKAGDLGGFVECESNLSVEPGDDAWIFDDAIACGESGVDQGVAAVRERGRLRTCVCVPGSGDVCWDQSRGPLLHPGRRSVRTSQSFRVQ